MLSRKNILLTLVIFCCFSTNAFAYLDPGTGSMIIQGLIGLIAAITYTAKIYWRELLKFFRVKKTDIKPNKKID